MTPSGPSPMRVAKQHADRRGADPHGDERAGRGDPEPQSGPAIHPDRGVEAADRRREGDPRAAVLVHDDPELVEHTRVALERDRELLELQLHMHEVVRRRRPHVLAEVPGQGQLDRRQPLPEHGLAHRRLRRGAEGAEALLGGDGRLRRDRGDLGRDFRRDVDGIFLPAERQRLRGGKQRSGERRGDAVEQTQASGERVVGRRRVAQEAEQRISRGRLARGELLQAIEPVDGHRHVGVLRIAGVRPGRPRTCRGGCSRCSRRVRRRRAGPGGSRSPQ